MDLYTGLRNQLVQYLKGKGIQDPNVLHAMQTVERHKFVHSFLALQAYADTALKIDCDQTISQPSMVALQSQLLEIKPREKVLEIGTGSGYQAAILSKMGARVYTIERHYDLYKKTTQLLKELDKNVFTFYGDGFAGLPLQAPFDKVLVTCGAPEIPYQLFQQLKVGGLMVIPLLYADPNSGREIYRMYRVLKRDDKKDFLLEDFGDCNFVPMLKNTST